MKLSFCSLSSGSSGNSYIIKSGKTTIILDAGISGKKILEGLCAAGAAPETLSGLLITHEHIDHVQSVRVLARKLPQINVYATAGTWNEIAEKVPIERRRTVFSGKEFTIGDITVKPFALSHDAAEPVGYTFSSGGKKIAVVTDTGIVTDEIHGAIKDADLLVLESNHDTETLRFCSYPYRVKRRIAGEYGHLSNDAASCELVRIIKECDKYRQVLLAHLSHETNFPEMAMCTVANALAENGITIGREVAVEVIKRDEKSPIFTISGDAE